MLFNKNFDIISTLLSIPGFILFFSFRGYFQAWVAKKLGDHTPEADGFLTMNPMAHINLIGFICLLLCGFGFGKPIRFSSRNYKNPKRDGAIQILSAPAAGIILAIAMCFIEVFLEYIGIKAGITADAYVYLLYIFGYAFTISLSLTVFLFLPLPGFDLYRLVANFLPYKYYKSLYTIEKYSLFIYIGFLLLINLPVIGPVVRTYLLDIPIGFLANCIYKPILGLFSILP